MVADVRRDPGLAGHTFTRPGQINNLSPFGNMPSVAATQESNLASTAPSYTKQWNGNSIWSRGGNGFGSVAVTRDNSRSRETSIAKVVSEDIEGKTGSGSLVGSSVRDEPTFRSAWSSKRDDFAPRHATQARTSEASTSPLQTRSNSHASLSQTFPSVYPQHAAINLNSGSTATSRPAFIPNFVSPVSSRSNEPPTVYTKFDRPRESSSASKSGNADSPIRTWHDEQALLTPSDDRRSTVGSSSYFSLPQSRTNSLPPSRHGDEHSQYMLKNDLPVFNSFPVQDFRPRNPPYSVHNASNFDDRYDNHVMPQFGQMNPENESRNLRNHRPSMPANGFSSQHISFRNGNASFLPENNRGSFNPDGIGELGRIGLDSLATDPSASPSAANGPLNYRALPFPNAFPHGPAAEFRPAGFGQSTSSYSRGVEQSPPSQTYGASSNFTNNQSQAISEARLRDLNDYERLMDQRIQATLMAHQISLSAQYPNFYALGGQNGLPTNGVNPLFLAQQLPNMAVQEIPKGPRNDEADMGFKLRSLLLEEFKNNSKGSKRYELKDIYGFVVEFSCDQHGSRFIQQKLETANSDEKERVFQELRREAITLMKDVFGNYVVQKFFEHGDLIQKKILAHEMKGQILELSTGMYGCRVVQKAFDHVLKDQQAQLVRELEHHVLKCVKDQNGNHVIQKAIERCPHPTIAFIFNSFTSQVQHLSVHPYGCRVIQRCLEHCDVFVKGKIMAELHEGMASLVGDQYGNYVVQHVVEHGGAEDKQRVLTIIAKGLESYSKHKFASNVVEKCLKFADSQWRRDIVEILVNGNRREGEGIMLSLIRDSYGNYVIQSMLDVLDREEYVRFLDALHPELAKAKRSGGKQVQAIEKKMHRFDGGLSYNGSTLPISAFSTLSLGTSPRSTPPTLTPGTISMQTSSNISINGDACEGATNSRKGSEPSSERGFMR